MASVKKKKFKSYTIEAKRQAITEVKQCGRSRSDVAKQFGIPMSTLWTWTNSVQKVTNLQSSAKKRLKTCRYPDIEDELLLWLEDVRSQKKPISGPIIQVQAAKLAKDLGYTEFKCSGGWLWRFKERHNISFKKLKKESANNLPSETSLRNDIKLPTILIRDYRSMIGNALDMDELFYSFLPSHKHIAKKSVGTKDSQCSSEKIWNDLTTDTVDKEDNISVAQLLKFAEIAGVNCDNYTNAGGRIMKSTCLADNAVLETIPIAEKYTTDINVTNLNDSDHQQSVKPASATTISPEHCKKIREFLQMQDDSAEALTYLEKLEHYIDLKLVSKSC